MIDWPALSLLPAPAVRGDWRVEHFEVTPAQADFTRLRAVVTRGREAAVAAGRYVALRYKGETIMSTVQMERRSNSAFVTDARGRVLVAGLGLGYVLHPVLAKTDVAHVTVIERSAEVIELVKPSLAAYGDKLTVVHDDIHNFVPPREARWNTIYFDIWDDITEDSLPEMRKLKRRFRRHLKEAGWIGCWSEDML